MTRSTDEYDFFVSDARADNVGGWVEQFLAALVEEHRRFTGGRTLRFFLDRRDIDNFADSSHPQPRSVAPGDEPSGGGRTGGPPFEGGDFDSLAAPSRHFASEGG